jgi:hypothetical protein
MSIIECERLISLTFIIHLHLIQFLLIDKVISYNDNILTALLQQKIMKIMIYYPSEIIVQSYYIIKYMTISAGKQCAQTINKEYQVAINDKFKSFADESLALFNDIMEFHFRPRGSHTKAALNYKLIINYK